MMLENLFARQAQEQAFLWLMAGGFLLGAMLQISGAVRRRQRLLGGLCDAATALCVLVLLLRVLLRFGGGVRAYGVLGIIIGLLLYYAGVSRLMAALANGTTKLLKRLQKTCRPKEGFSQGNAEMLTHDAARKE